MERTRGDIKDIVFSVQFLSTLMLVMPLNVTRLLNFFPITYKTTKKNYYRKLGNGKSFCSIHNSKPHFFSPLCTSSEQLALI